MNKTVIKANKCQNLSYEKFSTTWVQKLWFHRRWFKYRYFTPLDLSIDYESYCSTWPFVSKNDLILFQLWIGSHQKLWGPWNSQRNPTSGHLEFWCGKFLPELRTCIIFNLLFPVHILELFIFLVNQYQLFSIEFFVR